MLSCHRQRNADNLVEVKKRARVRGIATKNFSSILSSSPFLVQPVRDESRLMQIMNYSLLPLGTMACMAHTNILGRSAPWTLP